MTSWASVPRTRAPRADLAPSPSTPACVRSAALAATGALFAVGAATCTVPLLGATAVQAQEPPPAVTAPAQGRTVVFDYSAEVLPNDVYDTERAQAPLPLFRALGHRVDVEADYTGPPARLSLVARLSSSTGWSTSVPLANEVEVEGRGRVRASLDLRRLEDRAALVAAQTEMPFEGMAVELVAAVRDDSGTWTPSVALSLTPQQLRLAGEPATLVVRQEATTGAAGSATPAAPTPQSRLDDLLGWRPGGLLSSAVLTLALAGGMVVVRRRQDEDDATRARRRLGRLLLDVTPTDLGGLRVVHVEGPDALARLAERYGLLVLHWTDEAGEVFVVQDETTAYCWATGKWVDPAAMPAAMPAATPAEAAAEPTQRRDAERREEAERAAQAWAAVEHAYAQEVAAQQRTQQQAVVVPAPRRAEPVEVLADRPPREAGGTAGPSLFEVG